MTDISGIREHMEVIGADGVHVGTVDKIEGRRIKLTKADSGEGSHKGHHHYLSTGLVAGIEGSKVRLSTSGANVFMFQEEEDQGTTNLSTSEPSSRLPLAERSPGFGKKRDAAGTDWTTIGLGTAALGALAGALMFARKPRQRDDGFELRLQTDENVRLISSSKVEGTPVVGRDGVHIGRIDSFMVDKYSGRVAYAVMSFGSSMGFGESLFPLPWSHLTYDTKRDGYVLGVTKEQLAKAPSFKRSEAPEFSANYRRDVSRFYAPKN